MIALLQDGRRALQGDASRADEEHLIGDKLGIIQSNEGETIAVNCSFMVREYSQGSAAARGDRSVAGWPVCLAGRCVPRR